MRWCMRVVIGAASALLALPGPASAGGPPSDPSDLPDPTDALAAGLRQVCDLQWIAGVCEATGYPDPQYRSDEDPSPGQPFALRIGVLHEHSGYSDGDPNTRPEDYWAAAETGHNVVDGGQGDSGVIVDYLISSEHSENEKLPITTAEVCIDPEAIPPALAALDVFALPPLLCENVLEGDHHDKWDTTLAMAVEATDRGPDGSYTGFTAMRGFEWTNDYYNHLGVYFSRNVVNAKIDGSYLAMDPFWSWLQEDSRAGGGDDALVVFNHPGGWPALTPFDGDLPHNQILAETKGGQNWDDLRYVPAVDERVAGIEVNGGDDLTWYVKALTRGWHLGPIAAEDEHQREWSTSEDGKTLMLTRGRSPRDYYVAMREHRLVRLSKDVVGGDPGERATFPSVLFWADGTSVDDPDATVLGSVAEGTGAHDLHVEMADLPPGSPVVLLTSTASSPVPLGAAGADGAFAASRTVTAPAAGEDWWFVVTCPPGTADCGTGEAYDVVTAPIWVAAGAAPVPGDGAGTDAGGAPAAAPASTGRLPATGTAAPLALALAALAASLGLRRPLRRP